MANLQYLLQRHWASAALETMKMKAFVPCDVEDKINNYKCRIVEAVFEPLKIEETNARFAKQGFIIPDEFHVIAVNEDGTILLWGGMNSVYYLKKGEKLPGTLEGNLAFNDIRDLINRFKIKNKKPELDELMAAMKKKYSK